MHPEIKQDEPGMCPECGMTLVPIAAKSAKENQAASKKHAGHSTALLLRKFWVSAALSVPVVLYSSIMQTLFGWQAPSFPGSSYLPLILGTFILFYGGWIFLRGAWREIAGRMPGMMTLIGLAISVAWLWSVYAVFSGHQPLFWELTTLIAVMLLGHWIEMRAVSEAQGALKELSKLLPDTANVIRGEKIQSIPLSQLAENETVLVRPGEKIPADGQITDGQSDVNESMITGESAPAVKQTGDAVIAGTINGDGALHVRVARIGEQTFLAGIMRLVSQAQASKSHLQLLSDKAAFYLTVIAITGGVITFIAWLVSGAGIGVAVSRLVAVLVITCPHALGLAVPLVASISTARAAKNGFLVKQRLALEAARTVDTVLFDKTGTLTEGQFGVTDVLAASETAENEVLALAASLDTLSEHPIAKAIAAEAQKRNLPLAQPQNYRALKGRGSAATVSGKETWVGSAALVGDLGLAMPDSISSDIQAAERRGETVIFAVQEKAVMGAITLADQVRPESIEAVRQLKSMGLRTAMVTGDSEETAKRVADTLGLDEYFARVLPDKKAEKVKELQSQGRKVAMVGDGINDAPALAQADLGIAIGAGTNVAIESAGIILVRSNPKDIVKVINLSKMTFAKMIQNLFWATGYNIIAIPLAAGALAFRGIILPPAAAAILMSLSTVIVAANALLLNRKKL
ncbi:MAG: heavy metal translocating P-type ATPase, partial [Candidatus Saccharimonadales bacterium]